MSVCSRCGHENRPNARFCAGCGAPLAESAGSPLAAPRTQPSRATESPAPGGSQPPAAQHAGSAHEWGRLSHIFPTRKPQAVPRRSGGTSPGSPRRGPWPPAERRARLEVPVTELGQRSLRQTFELAQRLAKLLSRLHRTGYYAFGPNERLDQLVFAVDRLIFEGREAEFFKPAGSRQYAPLSPESRQRAESIAGDLHFFARTVWFWLTGRDPEQFDLGEVPNLPKPLVLILRRAWDGDYPSGGALLAEIEQLAGLVEQPTLELTLHPTRPVTRPPTSISTVSYQVVCRTDPGRQRATNEDRAWAGPVPGGCLCIVCDGMGGQEAGEVAAEIALATIRQQIEPGLAQSSTAADPGALLAAALTEANRQVFEAGHAQASDMGTTGVAALVIGTSAYVASAGDSRAYLFHTGQLTQITQDHSLVASLVLAGALAPDEVYSHPRRNEIYRFLGNQASLALDPIPPVTLREGDRLLLCSDGLWEMVRDSHIAQVLATVPEPNAACERLIQIANEQGGDDNISVVILKVERKEVGG
jgi:serine/threonine protein phosphatase PrpC